MKKFIAKHPIWFVVIVSMANLLLGFPIEMLSLVGIPEDALPLVGSVVVTAVPLGLIAWLGWWRSSGFTTTVHNAPLLWVPLLRMMVPIIVFGTVANQMGLINFILVAMFFTALSEEALSRGLFVRALLPLGKWHAVLIPSVLFGLGHITQFLFVGMPLADNLIQIADSTFFGIMYAAIRLRVGSIWPLIIIHMLGNTFTFIGGISGPNAVYDPPIGLFVVMWVVMIAYAIYLLSKPIVVTISDETPISESEPVPMIKPA